MNKIVLLGKLIKDPELKTIENGEMNITQKQLYVDYIKARKLDERG